MLQRHFNNLTDDVSYGDYKRSFAFIAQFFGLPKQEIIIEWLEFKKPENPNEPEKVALRYSKGLHKVKLPDDTQLIHVSPIDNIKQLEPAFRSKTKGKFMYPSKRCFFTVNKAINPFKMGTSDALWKPSKSKLYKYVTVENIKEAYIDPTYISSMDKSVMIITEKPIPVMKVEDKFKGKTESADIMNEGIGNMLKNFFKAKDFRPKAPKHIMNYDIRFSKPNIGNVEETYTANKTSAKTALKLYLVQTYYLDNKNHTISANNLKKLEKDYDQYIYIVKYDSVIKDPKDKYGGYNNKVVSIEKEGTIKELIDSYHINVSVSEVESRKEKERLKIFKDATSKAKVILQSLKKQFPNIDKGFSIHDVTEDSNEEYFNLFLIGEDDEISIIDCDAWEYCDGNARDMDRYQEYSDCMIAIYEKLGAELAKYGKLEYGGDWDDGPIDLVLNKSLREEDNSWYNSDIKELVDCMGFNEELLSEQSVKEFLQSIDSWKTSNDSHLRTNYKNSNVTDEEYETLKGYIDIIQKEDVTYKEYKPAFDNLCKFCHILPEGTIITKYKLTKGKENNNIIEIQYSENTKKIQLPEGIKLYHDSKVEGIKELIPQFKGKSERGYLYDKPRIYFSLRKIIPRIVTDYGANVKLHKYEATQEIKEAYVDPLVWTAAHGAVYVVTNKPIPVKEIKVSVIGKDKEVKEESEDKDKK